MSGFIILHHLPRWVPAGNRARPSVSCGSTEQVLPVIKLGLFHTRQGGGCGAVVDGVVDGFVVTPHALLITGGTECHTQFAFTTSLKLFRILSQLLVLPSSSTIR